MVPILLDRNSAIGVLNGTIGAGNVPGCNILFAHAARSADVLS